MTAAPESMDSARRSGWLLVVAVAAAWPVSNLLHNNWTMLIASDLERASLWWLGFFALTALAVVVASRLFQRIALARWALAASVGLVLFFLFEWGVPKLGALLLKVGVPRRAGNVLYLLLAAILTVWILQITRGAAGRRIVATFIVVGGGVSLLSLAADFLATGMHRQADSVAKPLAQSEKPERAPNVLVVLLDGYGRLDSLQRFAGFDNSAIVRGLQERGFTVLDRAVANYPVTYLSVSSLMLADYVATPEQPPFTTRSHFYDIIQGNNPVVASFRAMGYRYAHSGNTWGGSSCGGREDLCLNSSEGAPTREIDLILLQMTPLRLFLPNFVTSTERGNLEFIRGALDLLYARTPFFFFGHTMPPHPPFEWNADCSRKKQLPSLEFWSHPHEYADGTLCVNRQLTQLVDAVVTRDPTAIIVFMSDHGSAFTKPGERPLESWTDDMIAERFPTFVAIRAPSSCGQWMRPNLSNVNIGRFLVACVTGTPPEYRPDRFFTGAHEKHSSFGRVHEITARVEALGLR